MLKETKVENLVNARGNKVANQFIVYTENNEKLWDSHFISYKTEVAMMMPNGDLIIDDHGFEYSNTTSRHLKTYLIDYCRLAEAEVEAIKKFLKKGGKLEISRNVSFY